MLKSSDLKPEKSVSILEHTVPTYQSLWGLFVSYMPDLWSPQAGEIYMICSPTYNPSLNFPQINYKACQVSKKQLAVANNLFTDQFIENLYSNCAVSHLVVVKFKSCDRDVVCL